MFSKRRILITNFVAAGVFLALCVKFSAAQFIYACALFCIFLLLISYKNRKGILEWNIDKSTKMIIRGIIGFYSLILIPGILTMDYISTIKAIIYAGYALPFFMCWYMCKIQRIDIGVEWGLIISAAIAFLIGVIEWHLFPDKRVEGYWGHPNKFGLFIELIIPYLVYFFIKTKNYTKKILIMGIITIGLFCLLKTESRGAILGLFGGAVCSLIGWMYIEKKKKILFWGGIVIAFCIVAGGFFIGDVMSKRSGMRAIGGERIYMMDASLDMWKDHKLLGVGLANWEQQYYSERYHPEQAREKNEMPHNMLINFLSTTGIIGGMGYLIFLIFSFKAIWNMWKCAMDPLFVVCVMTAFWAFTIHGFLDQTIIYNTLARIYFALMGYSFAAYQIGK